MQGKGCRVIVLHHFTTCPPTARIPAIPQSPNRNNFKMITESAVKVDDLTRFLSHHQPTIVHFCGHGAGDDGLALEDNSEHMQLVSTQALAKLFDLFDVFRRCLLRTRQ